MSCRSFMIELEDFFALRSCRQSEAPGPPLPASISTHAAGCRGCAEKLEAALRSRLLLGALPSEAEVAPASDPYFYPRLRARIRAEESERRGPLRTLGVLWRDVAVAGLLFAVTLSTFLYGIHRTEVPNADAAIAVDVPLSNPYQTPERHDGRATPVDMLVSLLTP